MSSSSPTTLAQVIDEMRRRLLRLRRAGDWRTAFADTYLQTTIEIDAAVRRPRFFTRPAWIEAFDCDFAQRYFTAADCWGRSGCPRPWQLAFKSAHSKQTFAFQDVLLGMNAHINYDLPHSLDAVVPRGIDASELAGYKLDYDRLNQALGGAVDPVEAVVARMDDPLLWALDVGLGRGDERVMSRMIASWRARAWEHFILLRHTPAEAHEEMRLHIERAATDTAVMVLELGRALPLLYWPNRIYRDGVGLFRRYV